MKSLHEQVAQLQARLLTDRFGRTCRWFDAVESTNPLAIEWAKEGAPAGALIVAEYQRRGRGRFERSWTADPGSNLTFSLIVDHEAMGAGVELLPVATAVAVAESLRASVEPHHPKLKWPNDVMLAGRKVCGILIESALPSRRRVEGGYAVVGIGINVNQQRFPEELSETATSIFRVLGRPIDRIALLADVLEALESAFTEIAEEKRGQLISRFEALMLGLNKTVRFQDTLGGRSIEGTILGVDLSGGLRVRTEKGVRTLRAGEVTLSADSPSRSIVVSLPERPSSSTAS